MALLFYKGVFTMKTKLTTDEILDAIGTRYREPERARRALIDYILMGKRSLRELHQQYLERDDAPTKRLATIGEWSTKYEWLSRAAAVDTLLEEDRITKWTYRKEEVNETDWRNGKYLRLNLLRRYRKIAKTTDKDGITSLTKLVAAIKIASEMQRLATDEPIQSIRLTGAALDAFIVGQSKRIHDATKAGYSGAPVDNTDAGADDE
jgi:hypothetical protein